MNNIAEITPKTDDELQEALLDLRKEQLNLRFQKASGELASTARVRTVRRDIARIKTVQNQRKVGQRKMGQRKTAAQKNKE